MDKKILAIMVALVVIAAVVVVGVTLAASGGIGTGKAGGFTALFNDLEKANNATYNMELKLPDSWHQGDKKTVSDKIVDMSYSRNPNTHIYTTNLWFVYTGDKWSNPTFGTSFQVPQETSELHVSHGEFTITVFTATNLSAEFDNGDVISLTSTLTLHDGELAFGDWAVPNTS